MRTARCSRESSLLQPLPAALLLGALTTTAAPALAERHVALLVGVSDYGAEPLNLRSPPIDVALLGDALQGDAEFDEVIRVENPSRTEFVHAIKRAKESAGDGVVVFYFSGHAVSIAGENYLIPSEAALDSVDDVALETVSVRHVVNAFRSARLRVVVLDACRTNPFGLGGKSIGQGGLSRDRVDGLSGTLISYAAAPGSIAYDGAEGEPSPFTRALVSNLKKPDVDLPHLFMQVRGDLAAATAHLPRGPQQSEEVSSLTGRHYFTFVEPARAGGLKAAVRNKLLARAPAKEPTKRRVLVLDLENKEMNQATTDTITEMVSVRLSRSPSLEVVSGTDLRRMLDLEVQREELGCDDQRCLVELGEALGAELIVTGTVGSLGTIIVVTLSVLDTHRNKAVSRVEFQARDLEEVPTKLDDVILRVARDAGIVAPKKGTAVLAATVEPGEIVSAPDEVAEPKDAPEAQAGAGAVPVEETASTSSLFLWLGVGSLGAGAAVVVAGIVAAVIGSLPAAAYMMAYGDATAPGATRDDIIDAYGRADAARAGHNLWGIPTIVVGSVVALAGAAVTATGGALLFVE